MTGRTRFLALAAVFAVAAPTAAQQATSESLQNWPQWRGPMANGTAPQGAPPTEWSPEKNVKWKAAIPGHGSATPAIWGDKVFVLTAIETDRIDESIPEEPARQGPPGRGFGPPGGRGPRGDRPQADGPPGDRPERPERGQRDGANRDNAERGGERPGERGDRPGGGRGRGGFGRGRGGFGRSPRPRNFHQFVVMCLDRDTGEVLWQQVANESVPPAGHHQTNNFASGSPVTDGRFVYATFGSNGIYCYDVDGNLQWQVDLGDMTTRNSFGEGASPTLYGDTLVVPWDHEGDSFIVALDARNGAELWRQPRDESTQWSTPLVLEHNGRTQVITNATNRVRSYDLSTGELLWECGGQTASAIPSPVTTGDVVYCMSGFRGNACFALPLDASGDLTDSEQILWSHDRGTPYVPSPLLYDGLLYFTDNNRAILTVLDAATGEPVVDRERLPESVRSFYSSPAGAGGHVYLTDRNGTTLVIKHPAQEELEIVATNSLDEGIDASPAIVGDQLFLRGENHLYCIEDTP